MSQVAELPMPNTYVQLMVRATRDVPRLLAGTGLTPGMLTEGRSITVAQQLACIRNSLAMMRRKDWHLAWAHRVSAHFHGPISVAQLSAPTLGDGIDVFARYMHSRVPYMDWRGRQGARAYSLTITPRMPLGDLAPILFELPLLSLVSYVHSMRTGDIAGLTIELMHEPLVKAQDYRRWFDCEFRFGARRNAFVMPTAWRGIANVDHDLTLWRTALAQCRAVAGGACMRPPGIDAPVMAALHGSFTAGDQQGPPAFDSMARRLNLSPRTLSRRLTGAGTSYQAMIDSVRMTLAREMLDEGHRVGDVAQALGYANTSSFDRAFRRWYGGTPSQGRERVTRSNATLPVAGR
jgi:AraC-like DNA-binding protein